MMNRLTQTFALLCCLSPVWMHAQTTFYVNMECAPAFEEVFVTGPWCDWCGNYGDNALSDEDGDGIYSVSIEGLEELVEYKYAIDGLTDQEWLVDNVYTEGDCDFPTDGYTYANRVVEANNTAFDTYGSCDGECDESATITFQVNMSDYEGIFESVFMFISNYDDGALLLSDPPGGYPEIAILMTETAENIFSVDLELSLGTTLYYTYITNPGGDYEGEYLYENQEACDATYYGDRTVVANGDTILPAYCWGTCEICEPGCTDPLAFNFDPEAFEDDGSCLGAIGPNCQLGELAWEYLTSLVILPSDTSQMVFGIPDTLGQMAIALPGLIQEPGTGTTFAAMAFNPTGQEGLPEGLALLALPDSISSYEIACFVVAGTPLEVGEFELSLVGDLTISLFGQPYVIQDVVVNHPIAVLANPNPIPGCTYPWAVNYLSYANQDDGSCQLAGCTDPASCNHRPLAEVDDGSCTYDCLGCIYPDATNYEASATRDDGSCEFDLLVLTCAEDLDGSGSVGSGDLLMLLAAYGQECTNP